MIAVVLEGIALKHYPRIKALLRLSIYSVLENFGHRQINAWWRAKAFVTTFTRRRKWGVIKRRGYAEESMAALKSANPASSRSALGRLRIYVYVIFVIVIIFAIFFSLLRLLGDKKGDFLSETPTLAKAGGLKIFARARRKHFEIRTFRGWKKLNIKGVNLGIALPGKWFSEFPSSRDTYLSWLEGIAGMNANVVRVYTLLDPLFYKTLDEFNRSSAKKLLLIQEVWPDDEAPGNNLFHSEYANRYKREIETDIKALTGKARIPKRSGRAWGNYDTDVSKYLLGIVIGREITWEVANKTNQLNKDRSGYRGRYVSAAEGSRALESWVAEMCDHAARKLRESGLQTPVGFVSWPTLDPMTHPTESTSGLPEEKEHEDIEVLDPKHITASKAFAGGGYLVATIYTLIIRILCTENRSTPLTATEMESFVTAAISSISSANIQITLPLWGSLVCQHRWVLPTFTLRAFITGGSRNESKGKCLPECMRQYNARVMPGLWFLNGTMNGPKGHGLKWIT